MTKEYIINKIKTDKSVTLEQVKGWLDCLPAVASKLKPTEFKVGDVIMNNGLHHPIVLLKKVSDGWVCGLLTTEPTCESILEACVSRFFATSFFTKTLVRTKEPQGTFMGVFENKVQLKAVYETLTQETFLK